MLNPSESGFSSISMVRKIPFVRREWILHKACNVRPKWRPWCIRGSLRHLAKERELEVSPKSSVSRSNLTAFFLDLVAEHFLDGDDLEQNLGHRVSLSFHRAQAFERRDSGIAAEQGEHSKIADAAGILSESGCTERRDSRYSGWY